jgi:hypothetical protein
MLSSEMVPGGRQGKSPFVTSLYGIYECVCGVGGDCALRIKVSIIKGVARREQMVRLPPGAEERGKKKFAKKETLVLLATATLNYSTK